MYLHLLLIVDLTLANLTCLLILYCIIIDPRDAEDAVRSLDGTKIAGSRVRVEMSHGRSRRGGFHPGGGSSGGGGGGGGRHGGGRSLPHPPRNGGDYSPYRLVGSFLNVCLFVSLN